jgi:cob(I)alamin adenosyltransferase
MKIYTKTGDGGETGLFGGPRVRKDSLRIEAFGTVDEINAWLGLVRSADAPAAIDTIVARVQHELFEVGAALASPGASRPAGLGEAAVAALEREIDDFETLLPRLTQFILPGGTRVASLLHAARTVCRRAERRVVSLAQAETVSPLLVVYLNRLSDWLFVLARTANHLAGAADVPWVKAK